MFGRARKRRQALIAADAARDRRDWTVAALSYRRAIGLGADRAGVWIQQGHALKESGDPNGAERSYLRALDLAPGEAETLLHIGHARKLVGRSSEAVLAYGEALKLDPSLTAARDELIDMGARSALPEHGASGLRRAREFVAFQQSRSASARDLVAWEAAAPRAVADFDGFRRDYPLAPPPAHDPVAVHAIVEARYATPAAVRLTLLSLIDQSVTQWTACVSCVDDMADQPVASLAGIDPRIRFGGDLPGDAAVPVLLVEAGTRLDRYAIAWLGFALRRTGAAAVYADDDAGAMHWRHPSAHYAPRLFPMFDPLFFEATDEVPLCVLADAGLAGAAADAEGRRSALLAAADGGVTHVPRLLSTRIETNMVRGGRDDLPVPVPAAVRVAATADTGADVISLIVPTRDAADLLSSCIASLQRTADHPGRLDIIVMDNRSRAPVTLDLFERWRADGTARIQAFDEPFNWSRLNNRAASIATGDTLVFVNNDIEMLRAGWDTRLRDMLPKAAMRAVGARMLYPDGTLQHAGVLFGTGAGSPVHEGVGSSALDDGPLGRWRTRRLACAVTGAFLAVRADAFQAVGGFDEHLAIGFNDIDFCCRIRAAGGTIAYEPAIELVHHESKTRGLNDTLSKLEWDLAELRSFHDRWGEGIFVDPGYNPYWNPRGRPFDGFVEPSVREICDHIDRSGRPDPWRIEHPGEVG